MSQSQTARTGRRWKFSVVSMVQLAAIAVGLLGTVSYALAGPVASWQAVAAALMTAAAAMASGGLLGILFGVPRTADRGQVAEKLPVVSANTNLEQISDWLTKILVGVTLTQLGTIKREGGELFGWLAPALGGGDGAAAFAGSVVLYFAVVGFLTGWLYARLRLGVAMSTADSLIELARRADRAGDTQTAEAAKAAARNFTDAWRQLTPVEIRPRPDRVAGDPVPPVEDPGPAPAGGERPEQTKV